MFYLATHPRGDLSWGSILLDECISPTPKSSLSYHQTCQRFHCKTKFMSGTEVWEQVLVFLGYKMKQGGEKWNEGEEVTANGNSAGSSTASSKLTDHREKKIFFFFTIWGGWNTATEWRDFSDSLNIFFPVRVKENGWIFHILSLFKLWYLCCDEAVYRKKGKTWRFLMSSFVSWGQKLPEKST